MRIESSFVAYGDVREDYTLITKEAAIALAEQAKEQGKIISYRVVEKTATTGKIVATSEVALQVKDLPMGNLMKSIEVSRSGWYTLVDMFDKEHHVKLHKELS